MYGNCETCGLACRHSCLPRSIASTRQLTLWGLFSNFEASITELVFNRPSPVSPAYFLSCVHSFTYPSITKAYLSPTSTQYPPLKTLEPTNTMVRTTIERLLKHLHPPQYDSAIETLLALAPIAIEDTHDL